MVHDITGKWLWAFAIEKPFAVSITGVCNGNELCGACEGRCEVLVQGRIETGVVVGVVGR